MLPYQTPASPLDRERSVLPPSNFFEVFSHSWHFITKEACDRSWQTETRYPIQAANLWHYWKSSELLIGLRFGATTRYAMLDIDAESAYHPSIDLRAFHQILHSLEAIGVYRYLIVRSSESGGIHVYLPFSESVPTHKLAIAIAHCLSDAGFTIAAGTLEIFPNVKTYRPDRPTDYHGHRLPLQQGSYLLNDSGDIVTNDINHFLNAFELAANGNDLIELYNAIDNAEIKRKKTSNRQKIKSLGNRAKRWKEDCERVIEQGWTAYHQTNNILGVIAQYGRVFKGLAGNALTQFIHTTATTANGFLQWCRHQSDILERCRDWATSAEKFYSPYGSGERKPKGNPWEKNQKLNSHNQEQATDAIGRIQRAIAKIRADVGTMITSVRELVKAIARDAQCSLHTLYKHRSLWIGLLGCNSQTPLVEQVSEDEPKATENDTESLEPLPSGLLHPNLDYEGGESGSAHELEFSDHEIIIYQPDTPRRGPSSDRKSPLAPGPDASEQVTRGPAPPE